LAGPPDGFGEGITAVLSRIGERLSVLLWIESDEQLEDERSGGC
jgi:hypothetical protein